MMKNLDENLDKDLDEDFDIDSYAFDIKATTLKEIDAIPVQIKAKYIMKRAQGIFHTRWSTILPAISGISIRSWRYYRKGEVTPKSGVVKQMINIMYYCFGQCVGGKKKVRDVFPFPSELYQDIERARWRYEWRRRKKREKEKKKMLASGTES